MPARNRPGNSNPACRPSHSAARTFAQKLPFLRSAFLGAKVCRRIWLAHLGSGVLRRDNLSIRSDGFGERLPTPSRQRGADGCMRASISVPGSAWDETSPRRRLAIRMLPAACARSDILTQVRLQIRNWWDAALVRELLR